MKYNIKSIAKIILITLLLGIGVNKNIFAQIPSFTENYTSTANLDTDNNNRVGSGYLRSGYAYSYYNNDYYYYEWGNIAFCTDSLYVVWADDRNDGDYHVYIAKLDAATGNSVWSTNIRLDNLAGEFYRPSIYVKDKAHIYVTFGRYYGGLWELYAQRYIDNGTSLTPNWNGGVEERIDDGSPGANDMHWWVGDTEITAGDESDNSMYIGTTWGWIGSGDRTYVYKVNENGSGITSEYQMPYKTDGTESGGYFYRGVTLLSIENYQYIFAYKWAWNSSKYKGDRGPVVGKFTNNGSSLVYKGFRGLYTTKRSPWNLAYADGNVKYSVTVSTDKKTLYFVWDDKRDGTRDVWIQKMSISNTVDLSNFRGSLSGGSWANDIKVNNDASGQQLDPSVALNPFTGKLYVVYRDSSENRVELDIVNPDGSLQTASDIVLATYYNYHPRIVIDDQNNGYFYAAWLKYSGGRKYIEVVKYNESGVGQWTNSNVVKVRYKIKSHSVSKQLSFTPPALSVKKAMLTNFLAISNGYNIKVYLSHNGGDDWYPATNNKSVVFNTAGWEFKYKIIYEGNGLSEALIDHFTIKALKYYTGDLLYSEFSNTGYSGEGVIEQLGSSQSINQYVVANGTNSAIYYVRIKNTGNTNANFYVYGYSGNTYFDVKYYDESNNDITSLVTSWTGVLIPNLAGGSYATIKVKITPTTSSYEGQEFYDYLFSYVDRGVGLHDSVRLQCTAWKYRPDLLIKRDRNNSFIGDNIYENTSPGTQVISTNANTFIVNYEERHTNYLLIQNDGVWTDSLYLSSTTNFLYGNSSDWYIYITNVTKGEKVNLPYTVSIPGGETNLLKMIIYPRVSVTTNDIMNLSFQLKSLLTSPANDTLRYDNGKVTYKAYKKEPDLFIAPTKYFLSLVGDRIYYWTNTISTQALLLKTVPDRVLSFYVRLRNNGLQPDVIKLKISPTENSNWNFVYNIKEGLNYVDKTYSFTNSNGTNFHLIPDEYKSFRLDFTPNTNVSSGEWLNIKVEAYSTNKGYLKDIVYVRPYNKKLRPDVLISSQTNSSSFIGSLIYETNGLTQYIYKRLEIQSADKATNYIKVINRSPTEIDTLVLKGDGSSNFTNWNITYYNYTNNLDITLDITNSTGYEVTLQTNEAFWVKMVCSPKVTAPPDNIANIKFEAYSKEVDTQRDVVTFSNIAVELTPDIAFAPGVGYNSYNSTNYNEQVKGVSIISGVTNTNVYVSLQNDGGSVESFSFKSFYSNIGGNITNWIIRYFNKENNQEITSLVTNSSGYTISNMTPGSNVNIQLKILSKWGGNSDTNSAVGNMIDIKFSLSSVTKPIRRDVGSVIGTNKRGIPDIAFTTNNIGADFYSTNYSVLNTVSVKLHRGVPKRFLIRTRNKGIYNDDFILKVDILSNNNNWSYSFTNYFTGVDITSSMVGSGYSLSLPSYGSFWYYTTIEATNGAIGDKIYLIHKFDTESIRVRKDRILLIGEIEGGIPDIAATNLLDEYSVGWGKNATNDYIYDDIENGETNKYIIYLRNDIAGNTNDVFLFKQTYKDSSISVKYYTNGVEIPESEITNGLIFNINCLSNIPIYVTINADSASADSINKIDWKLSLTNFQSSYDTFEIQTKKLVIQPDIIVYNNTSEVGNNIYSSNYLTQSISIDILRGVTNRNLWIRVQNDGESLENYRIISSWSNEGGARSNWIVKYYDKSDLSDLTTLITNTGKVYNLGATGYKDIGIKVYAKDYGLTSTNSAVGNKIKFYFKFSSETRTNQYDTASALDTIRKGIPDIYEIENNIGYNVVTNQFVNTNRVVVGVVLGYPKQFEYRFRNIGYQQDTFKNFVIVKSNANWSYAFTNITTGADLTSNITNTNIGFISTNDNYSWDYERIRLTLKAETGEVGDSCYFYSYVDTVSKWKRRDVLLIVGKIVDGLPDIACSNYQNNLVTGWGKEATNEGAYDLIEENETNFYQLRLHNDTTGGSNALFVFQRVRKDADVNIQYYTNGVLIPDSVISNGLQLRIASDDYIPILIKFNLNGAPADSVEHCEWKMYLKEYPNVVDTFSISNKKVNFQPDIIVFTNGGSTGNNVYSTNNYNIERGSIVVISGVTNNDLILRLQNDGQSVEGYRLYSYWSNIGGARSNWIVKFYDKLTLNDITADVTNNGYLYPLLSSGQYKDVYVKVYPKYYGIGTTNSAVGNKLKLYFKMFSDTRNWHKDLGSATATIKRGIPDLYFADNNKGKGFITNEYVLSNQYYLGTIKGYSSSVELRSRNIGVYEDVFNLSMYIASNQGTWSLQVKDLIDNKDITSEVTNTNVGYTVTNSVNLFYNERYQITLTPLAGNIGDKIYLYGKVKSKTLEERDDYFWIVGEISEGLPDISCSNLSTGVLKGWGKSATNESMFNLLEKSNTNVYYILLRNEIQGSIPSDFVFKESSRISPTNATVLYYTNNVLIPYSVITQGLTNTIAPNSYKKIKVKINLDNFNPDEKLILGYNFSLKDSPSVADTFVITNRKMEIKPDMVIVYSNNNIGYNVISTNNYSIEEKTNIIYFSGVNNTNVKIKLINNGGSVDTFNFYSWWSNIGGNRNDWIVSYNNSVLDTYKITNGIYNYQANGFSTNIISLYIKPKWFGTGVTNSAVGNGIKVYFRLKSISLPYHKDVGRCEGKIYRGLSEIYLTNTQMVIGKNFVTNIYVNENSTNVRINPYDVKSIYVRLKNNGIYTDIYRYSIALTKTSTTPWVYTVSNITKGEDVTTRVFNTNTGIIITNAPGFMDTFKITITTTNGFLGDIIRFDNRLDTLTLRKRSDRVRIEYSLVGGIPDIACTNKQNNTLIGWGRVASIEKTFDKIRSNQTNIYRLILHNELGGTGSSEFVFRQTELQSRTNLYLAYYTNNVPINYNVITNGLHIYLPATNYKIVDLKINANNLNSGEGFNIRYRLNYIANTNLIDEFTITNLRVNPGATISFTGDHTNYTNSFYRGIDKYYYYYVKIGNRDKVPENMKVTARDSDIYWKFKYYDCDITTNDITASITDATNGWWTGVLGTNDYKTIKIEVWTLSNVYGGLTNTSWIKASPSQALNSIVTQFGVLLEVVGGIPDIFMRVDNRTIGTDTYNFTSVNSFFDKIENGETNIYPIYIQSLDSESATVNLTLKESSFISNGNFIIKYYKEDGTDITSSVRGSGFSINNLASNVITNVYVKITPATNTVTSNFCAFKLRLEVIGATNKYDIIYFTNMMVNPDIDLRAATVNDEYWLLSGYNNSTVDNPKSASTVANLGVSFFIALLNKDKVWDNFVLQGDSSDSYWTVKYYDEEDNDITSKVVNGIYTNKFVTSDTNAFARIRCAIIPTDKVELNASKIFRIRGFSAKNNSRLDNVYVKVNINAFVLKGNVYNKKTHSPIEGAHINAIDGLGRKSTAITGKDGSYLMYIYPVYNLKQTVSVSVSGYVGEEKVLYVENETNTLNFGLVPLNMSSDNVDTRIFPNPLVAGEGGTFIYAVPKGGHTTLELYDIYGRLLKVLIDEDKERGVYYVKWDGKTDSGDVLGRGVYFFVVDTPEGHVKKKLFIK